MNGKARKDDILLPRVITLHLQFCCSGKPQQYLQSQYHIDSDLEILLGKQELFTPFNITPFSIYSAENNIILYILDIFYTKWGSRAFPNLNQKHRDRTGF
jgi:hypothetical protein